MRRVEEEGDRVGQLVAERCAEVERRAREEVQGFREEARRREKRWEAEVDRVRREVEMVAIEARERAERGEREREEEGRLVREAVERVEKEVRSVIEREATQIRE